MRKALLSRWLISWLIATMLAHGLLLSVHRAGHAHFVAGTSSLLLIGATTSANSVTTSESESAPAIDSASASASASASVSGSTSASISWLAPVSPSQLDPKGTGVAQHEQGFCPVCAVLGFVAQSLPLTAFAVAQLSDRIQVASAPRVADDRVSMALPYSHAPPAI